MKTKIFTIAMFLGLTITQAQRKIMVDNAGTQRYYTSFNETIENLKDNDKVYLTGGDHLYTKKGEDNLDTLKITKKNVIFYGVGYDPRHTGIQPITKLKSKFISIRAKNITFTGIYIDAIINVEKKQSIAVRRCKTKTNIRFEVSSSGLLFRSRLSGIYLRSHANVEIFNNIISYHIWGISRAKSVSLYVKNNVILIGSVYNDIDGGSIRTENNIFNYNENSVLIYNKLGSFSNNIFKKDPSFGKEDSNINNIIGDPKFVDTTDYLLKKDSPAKGAGTGGTDCGIYGGSTPFIPSAITPKIVNLDISKTTNSEGQLKVIMKVEAQKK